MSNNYIGKHTYCSKYDQKQINYTLYYLFDSGYLEGTLSKNSPDASKIVVKTITSKGHDFINNLRDEDVFTKIKNVANGTAKFSLDIACDIAKDVATTFLKNKIENIGK